MESEIVSILNFDEQSALGTEGILETDPIVLHDGFESWEGFGLWFFHLQ